MRPSPLRAIQMDHAARFAGRPAAVVASADRPGAASGARVSTAVQFIPYALGSRGDAEAAEPVCELVGTFGDVEAEYAAIRRGAGILDSPHRGTIIVTGSPADRRDFLNRMVTQELKDLAPGVAKQALWLNRTGRIDADLLLIELGDRMLIEVDIHQAPHTVATLGEFVFSEDVQFTDASDQWHHIAVHGRQAREAVAAAAGRNSRNEPLALDPLRAVVIEINGVEVVATRRDQAAEIGLELIMPRDRAESVWRCLVDADRAVAGAKRRVRPIGWYAFNIARIEAGTPLFNVDFGTTNLPHETGILHERVSFTKGCYLGQEVVARMESRGHSKSNLVGLRLVGDALPVAGAQVFEQNSSASEGGNAAAAAGSRESPRGPARPRMGEPIGVITSSTLSPMLGAAPVAFALIRAARAQVGSTVLVNAEGRQVAATIAPLRFWPPHPASRDDAPPAPSADAHSRA